MKLLLQKVYIAENIKFLCRKKEISVQSSSAESANEPELRIVRSQGISRPRSDIHSHKCVICTHVKHLNIYDKIKNRETDRDKKFLESRVFLQDAVYSRTCDLQDEYSLFGAYLLLHKLCIKNYLTKLDLAKAKSAENQRMNVKGHGSQ